jgi:predicted ATP-grasp superfamily ATP-dependent carboligase
VAAVRGLAAGGYEPVIAASTDLSFAAASRFCTRSIRVPQAEEEGYAAAIAQELGAREYLAVFPSSDGALIALDSPGRRFIDKVESARAARAAGLEVPPSRTFSSTAELMAAAGELDYPVVLKPPIKTFPATRIDGPGGIAAAVVEDGPVIVQPFLNEQLRGVLGLVWHGELVASVHLRYLRLWPMPCGTVAAAETMAPDRHLDERLPELFRGYDGVFHLDLAGPFVLDVNPRIHAALSLAHASGANLASMYCDLLRGKTVAPVSGRSGIFFRWIEGDVKNLVWSVRRRRVGAASALRAVRPRRGAIHSYESIRDPGPMLVRFRAMARRLREGPRPR